MKIASLSKAEIVFVKNLKQRRPVADAVVLPFWKEKSHPQLAAESSFPLSRAIENGDFKGQEGEVFQDYLQGEPEKRILLLGLGEREKCSPEALRRAYGSLTKFCLARRYQALSVVIPKIPQIPEEGIAHAVVEGLTLPNYVFDRYKSKGSDSSEQARTVKKFTLVGLQHKASEEAAQRALTVSHGVYLARDLVNENADLVTPEYLAHFAKNLSKHYPHLKTTLFDKKRIQKEKMGLLLAVNRGSSIDPYFLIIEYKGHPKSKEHTVLVGKGITFDTGGLNLKQANMENMKADMGGAATCLGVMAALAELQPKVNVTAVIPTTENSIDANSYKPGDIYVSYSGKTVEMTNSDAEGRLILADALAYAKDNLKPTRMICFATLTGAIDVALGSAATGMMSTHDELAQELIDAGNATGERVWRMPLFEEYRDKLKSDIADIKSWNGRSAAACVAAAFLKEFTGDVPWAHLDIASTAYLLSETSKYLPKHATGVGIRLALNYLSGL